MSCNNILVGRVPVPCAALDIVVEFYNVLPISHTVNIMCWERAVSTLVIICAWQLSRCHQIFLLILWIPVELLLGCWSKTCEKSFSWSSIVRQHMEFRLNVAQLYPMESDSLRDYPKTLSIWVAGVWALMCTRYEYIWPASFLHREWRLTHFLSESTICRITHNRQNISS